MTPEDHNKYLGMAHLAYGAVHILLMLVISVFVLAMMSLNSGRGQQPPTAFMAVVMGFVVGINVLLAVPSFVAGYAFLKRKRWSKIAGIVAAVLSALRVPLGTAVSVYTFWFLFTAPGKALYDNLGQALPPAPPEDWKTVESGSGRETYVPPASPPDWR